MTKAKKKGQGGNQPSPSSLAHAQPCLAAILKGNRYETAYIEFLKSSQDKDVGKAPELYAFTLPSTFKSQPLNSEWTPHFF